MVWPVASETLAWAREIGLPLRMFRYQFGPFIAYFQSNRNDDLLALTDYARGVTEMSEEAWLWYGWGLYRQNDFKGARDAWNKALSINDSPYVDARLADGSRVNATPVPESSPMLPYTIDWTFTAVPSKPRMFSTSR